MEVGGVEVVLKRSDGLGVDRHEQSMMKRKVVLRLEKGITLSQR